MCGIAGFQGDWSGEDLQHMQELIRHRGPDDTGTFTDPDGRIRLVHTRLSIIDVAGGRQPLSNEDGTVTVIFNGEIYNHAALRRELEKQGHQLARRSDGEVIAHLYEESGIAFVKKLRGMFAIALWDARQQKLFLIRDRFGIKPLYYRQAERGFLFASEAKAILGVDRSRDIDPQALEWYLSFRYVPEDRTLFRGIRKLRPGHWLELSNGEINIRRYWDLRDIDPVSDRAEQQWVEGLNERLRESVDIRLMSEVPLGAFLSGGLDSSLIVAMMSALNSKPVETFSFGVGSGWHNESTYAEMAARAFDTKHHALSGDCNDIEVLRRAVWYLDEPLGDTAVIPTYLLSQLARRHVTVALTGEGADELLGGYDKYKILYYGDRVGRWLPGRVLTALGNLARHWQKPHRGLRFLGAAGDRARAYMELVAVFNDSERSALLSPEIRSHMNGTEPASEVIRRILESTRGPTFLDDLMHIDLQTWLVDDVLLKADKMSMAHGLEARVPFLDHEFAEYCASMPASLKLKGWREKHVLRETMRGQVPQAIVDRKKHGFTVSLQPWMRGGKQGVIGTVLLSRRLRDRGWFRPEQVTRLLRSNINNPYVRRQVFSLMAIELWAETFLDPAVL